MACEFLGAEFTRSRQGVRHQRDFCTLNDQGCLVDAPEGYVNCTRRTFALMQGVDAQPPQRPMKRKKRNKGTNQYAL
jgi:hypothetical protein